MQVGYGSSGTYRNVRDKKKIKKNPQERVFKKETVRERERVTMTQVHPKTLLDFR